MGERDNKGRFAPGNSISKGRPKGYGEFSKMCRGYTKTALDTLVDICKNSTSDSARKGAADTILAYGYGKPHQSVSYDLTEEIQRLPDVPLAELQRMAMELSDGGAESNGEIRSKAH